VIDHPGVLSDGEVCVEGEELRAGEGLEAVDDEGFEQGAGSQDVSVEEHAVVSEPGDESCDGGVRGAEDARGLAQSRALRDEFGDGDEQVGFLEPVVGGECGGAEGSSAVAAGVVLDSPAVSLATV
jgi:hypothetical protein